MKDEALKLALEAAKASKHGNLDRAWADEVIAKCEEALAQPPLPAQPVQEPSQFGSPEMQALIVAKALAQPPLPAQRPWVRLTDEDYARINALCLTPKQASLAAATILERKNTCT